jgi:predicted DNA-binding transcriptional regulator YafY
MDIMRHGADVRVVAPEGLRELVINKHREAAFATR